MPTVTIPVPRNAKLSRYRTLTGVVNGNETLTLVVSPQISGAPQIWSLLHAFASLVCSATVATRNILIRYKKRGVLIYTCSSANITATWSGELLFTSIEYPSGGDSGETYPESAIHVKTFHNDCIIIEEDDSIEIAVLNGQADEEYNWVAVFKYMAGH